MSYKRTSPMPVIEGGTGHVTLTNHGVLLGGAAGPIGQTAVGTNGQVLTGVTGADPVWANPAASSISITGNTGGALVGAAFTFTGGTTGLVFNGAGTTETLGGTLVVSNGGTGRATLTNHGVLIGAGTGAISQTAVGTTGQVLTGVTGADPVWSSALITDSGTFVPTVVGTTVAGVTTYTTQQGYYTRIGDTIFAYGYISISAATGTGHALFGGLPFTIRNAANYNPSGSLGYDALQLSGPIIGTANTTTAFSSAVNFPIAGAVQFSYTLIYNI